MYRPYRCLFSRAHLYIFIVLLEFTCWAGDSVYVRFYLLIVQKVHVYTTKIDEENIENL